MDITQVYSDIMEIISPALILSGMLALTLSLIVMLINMIVDSATGRGFRIGLKG